MTTSHWEDRPEDDREEPFDPFGDESETPFAAETPGEDADHFDEPAQLELGDEDQRLPWLEGDPDEDEETGYGAGQIIVLALAGLAVLALLLGGIWWATRGGNDDKVVADGGTITAPEGPYKVKPDDPGGRVASGTGDTAFAVAEGETRQMHVGDGEPAPGPGFDSVPAPAGAGAADDKPAAKPTPKPADRPAPKPASKPAAPEAKASAPSGPGVQVGAYSTRESAEKGWQSLVGQYEGLKGMRYRIVEGQADIGKVYRLQALPGDNAAARSLCQGLKAARIPCQVKD